MPLIYSPNISISDINKYLRQQLTIKQENSITLCNRWYQTINTNTTHIANYLNTSQNQIKRLDQIKIVRLRLGHTNLTHQHYFDSSASPVCPLCSTNAATNLDHIFNSCPALTHIKLNMFANTDPLNCLTNPHPENINKIINFIKEANIYHKI